MNIKDQTSRPKADQPLAENIKNIRELKNVDQRRKYLETKRGVKLSNIGKYSLDEKVASTRNCENMIGVTQIPLGVAGPLIIKGRYARGNFFIPLSTTEGALVASVNRGCKVVNLSNGVKVAVENIGATRGPVFKTSGISASLKLKKWFFQNSPVLKKIAEATSRHLTLLRIETSIVGNKVFARFYYDTKEAMGLNMATIATSACLPFIEQKTGAKCVSLAGNFDVDKKPAWLNFISGRGKRVWAESLIPQKAVKELLNTTSEKIHQVAYDKCLLGSIMSGSLGFNSHFANILAAIFIACGQDPAHLVEGSMGITTTEIYRNKDLYVSVYLPSLMVGTVGGGTSLETQQEALRLLGIFGGESGNALKFAEIIGGAVLAGELSLLGSLAQGSLAEAHLRLARGKPNLKIKDQNAK